MLNHNNGSTNTAGSKSAALAQTLYDQLKTADSFDIAALKHAYQGDLTDQQFGLVVHEVRERLRRQLHVEFIVPRGGRPGYYVRANDVQKLNRSRQFSRTAKRKHVRAYDVACAVNPDGLPDNQRRSAQATQERLARDAVRSGLKSSELPTTCDIPEMPRRGM